MIDEWIGHYYGRQGRPVSRLSAAFKLGVALAMIVGTVLAPPTAVDWFIGMGLVLVVAVALVRLPLLFLLKRLAWLSPFILSVALVNALQRSEEASCRERV